MGVTLLLIGLTDFLGYVIPSSQIYYPLIPPLIKFILFSVHPRNYFV